MRSEFDSITAFGFSSASDVSPTGVLSHQPCLSRLPVLRDLSSARYAVRQVSISPLPTPKPQVYQSSEPYRRDPHSIPIHDHANPLRHPGSSVSDRPDVPSTRRSSIIGRIVMSIYGSPCAAIPILYRYHFASPNSLRYCPPSQSGEAPASFLGPQKCYHPTSDRTLVVVFRIPPPHCNRIG